MQYMSVSRTIGQIDSGRQLVPRCTVYRTACSGVTVYVTFFKVCLARRAILQKYAYITVAQ